MRIRNLIQLFMGVLALCCALSFGNALADGLPDFTKIVAKEGPAVVNISSTTVIHNRGMVVPNLPPDDPIMQFFQQYGFPQAEQDSREQSLGSGFIISHDGLILTNAHVVNGAQNIMVKLTDRRQFKAKLIGLDKRTDIALLKIDAHDLPTVTLGNPRKLKPGQWVLAIGEPFGLENSVTQGIVSATGRSLPSDSYVPFIQTDVPINPGNSGGPLFNLNGEVVGINSQIYTRSGGYMGLSFAIPIDVAMHVVDQLKAHGHVIRGYLGVNIQDLSYDLAKSFGLDQARGALIAQVMQGSPAAKAGLQPSDVVLKVDGREIESASDMQRAISVIMPGTTVHLEIWRKGHVINVDAVLAELPADVQHKSHAKMTVNHLGIAAEPLTKAQREDLGVESGVAVKEARGLAFEAGIRPGDVIVSMNNSPIASVAGFNRMADAVRPGQTVALLVRRGSDAIFVAITLPEK